MTQAEDVPISEETYGILTFLSGYGLWFLLAIAVIIVGYYRWRKK